MRSDVPCTVTAGFICIMCVETFFAVSKNLTITDIKNLFSHLLGYGFQGCQNVNVVLHTSAFTAITKLLTESISELQIQQDRNESTNERLFLGTRTSTDLELHYFTHGQTSILYNLFPRYAL